MTKLLSDEAWEIVERLVRVALEDSNPPLTLGRYLKGVAPPLAKLLELDAEAEAEAPQGKGLLCSEDEE